MKNLDVIFTHELEPECLLSINGGCNDEGPRWWRKFGRAVRLFFEACMDTGPQYHMGMA